MKLIPLTQGKFAQVDDDDFAVLSVYNWYAVLDHRVWYARRAITVGIRKQKIISMHGVILGLEPGEKADHRDTDGLNNQRSNLRRCTTSQNGGNRRKAAGTNSRFKGVCWHTRDKRWTAGIRTKHIGNFESEEQAARAYDVAAKAEFGEFARLNFPENKKLTTPISDVGCSTI